MSESFRTRWQRHMANLVPVYRRTGGRIEYIAGDWSEVRVRVPLNWQTRNYVGTVFGGSIFGAVDPVYMIMLLRRLGRRFIVWDKAATIRFLRPGRTTLRATCVLPDSEIVAIKDALVSARSVDRVYTLEVYDEAGTVCAEIEKTLYIRRKD